MRHVSPLRSVTLSSTSKLHTLTQKNVKEYFGSNAKVLLDTVTYLYVLILLRDGSISRAEVGYLHYFMLHM